jgi:TP901 family phage tail tape measure protein
MATLKLLIDASGAQRGAVDFRNATITINNAAAGVSKNLHGVADAGSHFGQTLSHVLAAAGITLGVHKVVHDLLEFETGLVRVGKATGIHGQELDAFGDDIVKMSTHVPIATHELLELGFAAGQLGVHGKENIMAFTEAVAFLGTTGNLAGEEAAQSLARILNVTRESFGQVKNLASTIVQVAHGDATTKGTAATEAQIARTSVKVAQAAAPFNVKSADVVALAASYASVGVEAQVAATTTGKLLRAFDEATRVGDTFGSHLGEIARVSGMTSKEFQNLYKNDPSTAFAKFVQGLGKIQAAGGSATEVMQDLNLADERLLKAILPLAKGSEDLVNRLALARKEFSDPKRLDIEAGKQFVTLASQLKMLGNTFEAFFLVQRGKADGLRQFVQTLNEALQVMLGFRQVTDQTSPAVKILVSLVKDFVAVLGVWAAIKVVGMLNDMRLQVLGFAEGIGKATILTNPLLSAVLAVGVALSAWTVGTTLIEQFQSVAELVENLSYSIAKLQLSGGKSITGTLANFLPAGTTAVAGLAERYSTQTPQEISNLKQLDEMHDKSMKSIRDTFAQNGGSSTGNSFGKDFVKNFLGATDQMRDALKGVFGTEAVAAEMAKIRKGLEDAGHAAKEGGEQGTEAYDAMHEALRKNIEQLEFEGKYLKLNNLDRQVASTLDKLRAEIGDEINDKDEEALHILAERIKLNARLNAEHEIDQEIDRMREELELGQLGNDQRQEEILYRQVVNKYIEQGIDLTEDYKNKTRDFIHEYVKVKDAQDRFQNFANNVGDAFGRAFENAAIQGKSFKETMLGLIQDVEQALIHELVTTQIVKAVSGAVSGSGLLAGLFGAQPTAHATGGWVTSPTFFNAGGTTHVAGEAGPEKISTAREYWGLVSAAQRGGESPKITNVNMTVVTQNADSFMKSKRQITAEMKRGIK